MQQTHTTANEETSPLAVFAARQTEAIAQAMQAVERLQRENRELKAHVQHLQAQLREFELRGSPIAGQ